MDFLLVFYRGINLYGILFVYIESLEYVILGVYYDFKLGCLGVVDNVIGIVLIFGVL